ncbi:hypothetical protein DNTS_014283 [Danionella cerebrum]|uniref:Coiled-coil domain-containing protein n=1 Tax=Danionella cerebrum TaxID=2873325 RepID=A0A553R438_9TELE|nr:hypothetical protein DNTS_014283 [Danionella translucida]
MSTRVRSMSLLPSVAANRPKLLGFSSVVCVRPNPRDTLRADDMADFSIDQNNLPGVKEDHCLAHNLQEQEIESHLASNVYKSRLAQQDLQVAKRLQEEEDQLAKAQSKRQHRRIERIDNEMAQEIQEQLVRQAEQQRQQEEKDEAIARKLQDREMKEERKRHKQMEANFEEDYYEDKGVYSSTNHMETYKKEKHHSYSPVPSQYNSPDPSTKRNPGSRSQYQDYEPTEFVRSRVPENANKGKIPDYNSPERRTKYTEEYLRHKPLDLDCREPRRTKKDKWDDLELTVPGKTKAPRDFSAVQEKVWDKERNRDRERKKNGQTTKDRPKERNRARSEDRHFSGEIRGRNENTEIEQNGCGRSSRDGNRKRHRNGEREMDFYSFDPARGCSDYNLEWEHFKDRPRLPSGPNEVFEEPTLRGLQSEGRSPGHSPRERGRKIRGDYGMKEATHGMDQLDLHDQELKDMEVARRLQQEEIQAIKGDKRAAQVAQDEEMARRLMEEEKREYKRSRDKEKQAMERKRPEVEYKPLQEEVVRPRSREEVLSREEEYQRVRNHKPARPPPPTHHYENINPSYVYAEGPYTPSPQSRPEAAYKGAYYRQ